LEASEISSRRPVRQRRRLRPPDPDPGLAELQERKLERAGGGPAKRDLEAEGLRVEAHGPLDVADVQDRERLSEHRLLLSVTRTMLIPWP
jgi:hypothetical protein